MQAIYFAQQGWLAPAPSCWEKGRAGALRCCIRKRLVQVAREACAVFRTGMQQRARTAKQGNYQAFVSKARKASNQENRGKRNRLEPRLAFLDYPPLNNVGCVGVMPVTFTAISHDEFRRWSTRQHKSIHAIRLNNDGPCATQAAAPLQHASTLACVLSGTAGGCRSQSRGRPITLRHLRFSPLLQSCWCDGCGFCGDADRD